MSEISKSALGESFDREFEAKVAACTNAEQIKELMHSRELERGLIKLDWDQSYRIPLETPQPSGFATTVIISGVKHVLEASSETELRQKETELYRRLFSQPAAGAEQPRDPATGQFRASAEQERTTGDAGAVDAGQQAELELQFKRGEISSADYLEQSGAIKDYLSKEGISIDALKTTIESTQLAQNEKSWVDATKEFLASSDWPGGDANRGLLGQYLLDHDLIDAEDKTATLAQAYQALRKDGKLQINPATELANRLAEARDPAELRQILNYKGDSSVWGGR